MVAEVPQLLDSLFFNRDGEVRDDVRDRVFRGDLHHVVAEGVGDVTRSLDQRAVGRLRFVMLSDRPDKLGGQVSTVCQPLAGRTVINVKQMTLTFQLVEAVLASDIE